MKKILLLLALFFTTAGYAQNYYAEGDTCVHDLSDKLTDNQIDLLNRKIYCLKKLTSIRLQILLVDTIPANTYNIESYAANTSRKLSTGKSDSSLIYIAAIKQKEQWLGTGKRSNYQLTDSLHSEILPITAGYYKKNDYNGGLQIMVNELINNLVPDSSKHLISLSIPFRATAPQSAVDINNNINLYALILFTVLAIWFVARRIMKRKHPAYKKVNIQVYYNNYLANTSIDNITNMSGYDNFAPQYNRPSHASVILSALAQIISSFDRRSR